MKTFEVHLAIPRIEESKLAEVRRQLERIGISKTKYFQNVNDLRPITPGCMNGHDISNPGTMSTVRVADANGAVELAKLSMSVLQDLGIHGMNFEIEKVITGDELLEQRRIIANLLGEFHVVPNSPQFENHLIYRGTSVELPSDD
ncbi:MAG: hypothetical protein OEY44_03240 [Candidatus Peregrinibacteria bacterium]|nr:hypothetical protein [Candidatus Peregrinibacteria bacterium]